MPPFLSKPVSFTSKCLVFRTREQSSGTPSVRAHAGTARAPLAHAGVWPAPVASVEGVTQPPWLGT